MNETDQYMTIKSISELQEISGNIWNRLLLF
jgi:hypothetical protein